MSVQHTHFTYRDGYGVTIHAQKWEQDSSAHPETGPIASDQYAVSAAEPLGVIQILHGVGEHSGRYSQFARELAAAGFIVYAEDHRGHGKTGAGQHSGNPAAIGKLGPGGLRAAEDAITQLTATIRETHPLLPVAVFAHSWGSLMAQRIIQRDPHTWDAVVLSGSAYRTPLHLNSGDLNRSFGRRGGYEWLSRDPQVAADFEADPLCGTVVIPLKFGILEALKLFGKPRRPVAADVPILITSGAADPLNLRGGLRKLAQRYRDLGVKDVTLRLYPGARHEMLFETNKAKFKSDVSTWLTDRLLESTPQK